MDLKKINLTKKQKIIIGASGALVIIALIIIFSLIGTKAKRDSSRDYTIKLANIGGNYGKTYSGYATVFAKDTVDEYTGSEEKEDILYNEF